LKITLEYEGKNTAITTLKQVCLIKCTQQHIAKTKLKRQEEGRNLSNDENKEDDGPEVLMSLDLILTKKTSHRART